MKTNIKMRVTPEQSKIVQRICFNNDIEWSYNKKKVSNLEAPFLYIYEDEITYSFDVEEDDFVSSKNKEVNADLFIRTNGTCEETKTSKYPHFEKMLNNMNENFAEAIKMVEENEEKELENAKYKLGDFLKGKSGEYKGFYIEIEDTHNCLAGTGFFYTVKNASNEEHYSLSEKYLDKYFKLQKNENSKYKVGDTLKGISGVFENFFIEIEEVSTSETGAIYYKVKDIENEKQYTYTERYLEQHFELKTDEDNATNPNHYNQMKIQPNEYITANYECFSWNTANVIKYVSRYKSKNGIEDLEKAIKYLQFEIEELKKVEQC